MLENNNQIAVQRLGIRSLKQNKTRNLFVILAVVLTTFMFTTVFSIGFSIAKNLSIMMVRQQGTRRASYWKSLRHGRWNRQEGQRI